MRNVFAATAVLMLAVAVPAGAQAPAPGAAISGAVADARRPAADTARDAARKPAQIVAFAGVKPGDVVAELLPGGGYYTRILAAAVGPQDGAPASAFTIGYAVVLRRAPLRVRRRRVRARGSDVAPDRRRSGFRRTPA